MPTLAKLGSSVPEGTLSGAVNESSSPSRSDGPAGTPGGGAAVSAPGSESSLPTVTTTTTPATTTSTTNTATSQGPRRKLLGAVSRLGIGGRAWSSANSSS